MKRRSRAGTEAINGRHRKTPAISGLRDRLHLTSDRDCREGFIVRDNDVVLVGFTMRH
jgi:hypothetical protein